MKQLSIALVLMLSLVGCGNEGIINVGSTNATTGTTIYSPASTAGSPSVSENLSLDIVIRLSGGKLATYESIAQPAVLDWVPDLIGVNVASGCVVDESAVFENVGPYSTQIDIESIDGTVLYVDEQSYSFGDGSRNNPYSTIKDALSSNEATENSAVIMVAGGRYEEDGLVVSAGQYLFGGFDRTTWRRDLDNHASVVHMIAGDVEIATSGDGRKSVLDGFTLYGSSDATATVNLQEGSELILRNSTIYISMQEVTWTTYGDTDFGIAVYSSEAKLQAYHNRFLVDSATPEHVISGGVRIYGGCQVLARNHFVSMRTSVNSYHTEGAIIGNVIEDGYNGIGTHEESIDISHNVIGLYAHGAGCGYAIYMGAFSPDTSDAMALATSPEIEHNTFVLQGGSAKGINESYVHGDPVKLIGNHFVMMDKVAPAMGTHMLYGDADGPHDSNRVNQIVVDIDAVNAMSDIPENFRNTAESLTE